MNNVNRFDLLEIVKNGVKYLISEFNDPFKDLPNIDDHFLIVPNMALIHSDSITKLFERYYLHEIVGLGSCYKGHCEEPFAFWHISKRPTKKFKAAIFYADAHPDDDKKTYNDRALIIPSKYTNTFIEYCNTVSEWINFGGRTPVDKSHKYEFVTLDYSEFDSERVYAPFYRKENADIRKLLRNTDIVPLIDVASAKRAHLVDTTVEGVEVVKLINNSKAPNYPFDLGKDSIPFPKTTLTAHKGDIVAYSNFRDFYLLNFEPEYELYTISTIIKAQKVCPEYLYLYLKSETAKRIWSELHISVGAGGASLLKSVLPKPTTIDELSDRNDDLLSFPVVLPRRSKEYYIGEFQKIASPQQNSYALHFEEPLNSLEDILDDEIVKRIRTRSNELVRMQIEEDLAEINMCYKNKAYKATLILCGSVLEAVLIDWLSELKGIDYFSEELKHGYFDKNTQSYTYTDQPAGLADYIIEINNAKWPNWRKEAEEAHEIREKRNLVHAKLCLKVEGNINEGTCLDAIQKLQDILESRWKG